MKMKKIGPRGCAFNILAVRNVVAASSCFYTRLWFCSQGGGVLPQADTPLCADTSVWEQADTPPPPRTRYCSGRYASCWNAFLYYADPLLALYWMFLYYQNWDIAACCHSDDYCICCRTFQLILIFIYFTCHHVPVKIWQKGFVSCLVWESVCTNVQVNISLQHGTSIWTSTSWISLFFSWHVLMYFHYYDAIKFDSCTVTSVPYRF